jgi:predicted ATPase
VFGRFIGVFARPEHPLALFLDDLQWLDAATLRMLFTAQRSGSLSWLNWSMERLLAIHFSPFSLFLRWPRRR